MIRMNKYCLVVLFFLFLINNHIEAQKSISKDLVKKASKALKEEQYTLAEKYYLEANRYYPIPTELGLFALERMKIGDIKSANKIMDTAILSLNNIVSPSSIDFNKTEILKEKYFQKGMLNFDYGDPTVGIPAIIRFLEIAKKSEGIEKAKKELYEYYVEAAVESSYYLNDKKSLVEIRNLTADLKLNKSNFTSDVYIKLIDKKFEEVISILSNAIENGQDFSNSKELAKRMIPMALANAGEYQKSIDAIQNLLKTSIVESEMFYAYPNGICALGQNNYLKAINYFSQALRLSKFKRVGNRMINSSKFIYYTKRAEAYLGLNDFVKAKNDFESALTYFPDFEPALNGLAKLEGRIITERRIDKTPPVIVISEPAAARGLKIVGSGKDVMVKGIATDPSGLKSVSVNGNMVYSKEEGDFWGVIPLSEGKNIIKIIAMDMAGNAAEQIIEIEKPQNAISVNNDIVPVTQKEGRNFILLIASQNYDDQSIPSLDNPIPDAIKLKMVLKNSYNFNDENIITLFNPERSDFKKRFIELSETLQPEDNLIIFYAGHGIWVEKEKKGYWLLTDAKRSDLNTWLPNKEVLTMISNLSTRHTLLITDACFSGSVFKTRSIGSDAPPAVREMSEKISRVAITSGNDTEVPDQSVFMKYLIKALSENKEKYLTAQKMFITQIIEAVMTESKTEPRYGTLELAGHVGGDFIFIKK